MASRSGTPVLALLVLVVLVGLMAPASGVAQAPPLTLPPVNDLFDLGAGSGQTPMTAPVVHRAEPPLVATPQAKCGAGAHPEPGVQGRVPAGSGANGLWCNLTLIAHQGTSGGFKVLRYIDSQGHECAFYDTALLFPTNAINAGGTSLGVAVLDMSDPAHPVQTDTLSSLPMLSPHESLVLNTRRGLLAAVNGNPSTYPGLVSIYDVHADCRHPVLDSTSPVARLGHESGFSPDGRTFWVAGGGGQVAAWDVTNPKAPFTVWAGNMYSHGLNLSANGRTLYQTDPIDGNLGILDVSQVQDRKPNPQVKQISRITWDTVSIPQNTIPIRVGRHPYLIEFDEFAFRFNPVTVDDRVGAARIIDIADPAHPKIVSDLRLQVNMRDVHSQLGSDPYPLGVKTNGYAAHYCGVPSQNHPRIVACSFLNSGLRIFDIRDVRHPREVGYFVSPPSDQAAPGQDGDMAFSQPAFDSARHDVWYSDATSGFYVLHLGAAAWPRH